MLDSSSGESLSLVTRASNFSTGMDSPVRLAWIENRSLELTTRTSPGIMSPAESLITSPGTKSLSGISRGWPSRITVAVTLIIALSLAAAESARHSCTNRSVTPNTTITNITMAESVSPVRNETTARTDSRITSGLRVVSASRQSHPCCFSWATSLGPYFSSRASASASLSPSRRLSSVESTSGASRCAASASRGETRIAAPAFLAAAKKGVRPVSLGNVGMVASTSLSNGE